MDTRAERAVHNRMVEVTLVFLLSSILFGSLTPPLTPLTPHTMQVTCSPNAGQFFLLTVGRALGFPLSLFPWN